MIAVDVSASMLAEDVRPNRLTQAKRELGLVIDGLEGDLVGVVAFAGTAFLQCPLTLDYGAARTLLDLIGPDLIPTPGTSLADAMDTALGAFPAGSKKHRALVLLTDGEDHSGKLRDAEKRAVEEGVRVFPIGFGSAQGEAIPLRDASGALVGYKKDSAGQTVMSKRDDSALRSLAEKTGGTYFPATQGEVEVQRLLEAIGGMEKRSLESPAKREP
jgi:Ca-activated chloride channel family protein